MEWDWDLAERSFRRAIELDPSYSWAHYTYALQLTVQGRFDEAIEQLEEARRIDPVSTSPVGVDLGSVYALKGDLESAARAWQEALELNPDDYRTHRHIGNHLCRMGSFESGLESLQRAHSLVPDEERVLADLGYCHALAGNHEKAREFLRKIETNAELRYVDPVHPALVHLGLGETDRAIELLQRAYEIQSPVLGEVIRDPRYASLHADPYFARLVRDMGLSEMPNAPRG